MSAPTILVDPFKEAAKKASDIRARIQSKTEVDRLPTFPLYRGRSTSSLMMS
jgi:hypothetical protein